MVMLIIVPILFVGVKWTNANVCIIYNYFQLWEPKTQRKKPMGEQSGMVAPLYQWTNLFLSCYPPVSVLMAICHFIIPESS